MVARVPLEAYPNRYKPGKEKTGGRQPGSTNRTTRILKEAIILAAEQVGFNNRGKDGLEGYLRRIAIRYPEEYCALLAKVLPLQITGANDGPLRVSYSKEEAVDYLVGKGIPIEGVFDRPAEIFLPAPKTNGHAHVNGNGIEK